LQRLALADTMPLVADWFAYVLVSTTRERTYVGVTTDLERRARQHNGELGGGARATRAGRPWKIGRVEGPFATRGEAQVVEYRLRRRRGRARLAASAVGAETLTGRGAPAPG
jgi:predicted GIY-YIG superfamily endonuclease